MGMVMKWEHAPNALTWGAECLETLSPMCARRIQTHNLSVHSTMYITMEMMIIFESDF